jgi:hypothetical protein
MDESEVKKLKVAELKEKLTLLNLPTTGKKEELVQRLLDHAASTAIPDSPLKSPLKSMIPTVASPTKPPPLTTTYTHAPHY